MTNKLNTKMNLGISTDKTKQDIVKQAIWEETSSS